jgi:integrase
MLSSGSMNDLAIVPKPVAQRRRRFQRGSLQKRKSRSCWNWIVFWWEDGRRRRQLLGPCSTMSRPEALAEMGKRLQSINAHAGKVRPRLRTLGDWIRGVFLPFSRRKWKLSTASTTGDRIRKHLIADLGSVEIGSLTRDRLQQYLEQKLAQGLSFSLVDHLRWDLRAIFRLAVHDGLLPTNPAEILFTPRRVATAARRVLCPEQIQAILQVLDLREQLLVRLALFSGMRPGEILALQWKHVAEDHVAVVHRLYRGQLDRPKSERSQRTVALSSATYGLIQRWRQQSSADPEAWVFPSVRTTTPLGRDNAWRRLMAPKFKTIGLDWATFQVMRRTHASLCRQAGIDPKLVADQLGHGLRVNLDVYTVAGLDQRQQKRFKPWKPPSSNPSNAGWEDRPRRQSASRPSRPALRRCISSVPEISRSELGWRPLDGKEPSG